MEVTIQLPGVKPEGVKVEIRDRDLWITGEKKEEKVEKGKTYHRVERRFGEFRRMITLPTNMEAEKFAAAFKDGVLKVMVPKKEEAKAKAIEVKAA